ncbi:putative toxin-antitoxin system toxin component, PIN family [Ottowia sp.]|uniref:putative toxin-antitoxin system toxin component, PIN family n=1 Tax=Ottowia sp. TaxID=1898956 RepID=UPI0025CE3580|nr:putative toxin-antitoxin system toxin component, PIN family [Ottowia sp.]MBK6612846.1 putative toxin-antitoxin system toxin component, PIN family [Ottowia sp.]MBK6748020.1 putative toxin-antitoxin system toxin component, PIN family [Ottowia sp.]
MPALAAVLDTNVLLPGIAYPGSVPGKLIAAWRHGALDVVLSSDILDELRRVLPRLAHRHGLGPNVIDDLIDALAIQAELVEPEPVAEPGLTDAADQPVLGTLLTALRNGQAQSLVTGDKALLALRERYPIRTPAEFWAAHGSL